MIDPMLLLPLAISFLVTLLVIPLWDKKARQIGLIWKDMNKSDKVMVPGSGGLIAVVSFLLAVLAFIAYRVFYLNDSSNLIEMLSLLLSITLLAGIGFVDDLMGWQHGGLSIRSRLILVAIASIPLVVINAGKHTISLPLIGLVNLGLIYPLIFIPIGIIGATTTYNFLAGFNGLEAGQGIIILSALSIVSYVTGNIWLSFILLCMVLALIAFLFYNFYPASIFPGNSVTYGIGGLIAASAILGNFEKIAVFLFIPYIIEVFLKSRGRLKKHSFGIPQKDGSLKMPYDKIYGLEHLSILILSKMKSKVYEKDVVLLIYSFQIIICLLAFLIFRNALFA